MKPIAFASSNPEKFAIAQYVCGKANIKVEQVFLDIDEIQGEKPELVVTDKVKRAYEQYGQPIVVSDDFWNIRALNGFPGAYMKSMNHWFTPDDFLRLMHGIEDRYVTIEQYLAYYDSREVTIFSNAIPGVILDQAYKGTARIPCMAVVALDIDNGKCLAEVYSQGPELLATRYKNHPDAWHELVNWYKNQ